MFQTVVHFLWANQSTLLELAGIVLTILRLTAWGHSRQKALETVVQAIEDLGAAEVKQKVATAQAGSSRRVAQAIQTAVDIVNPGKPTPGEWAKFLSAMLGTR